MLAGGQGGLLRPGSSEIRPIAINDGIYVKTLRVGGREDIMLCPLRWKQYCYRGDDLLKTTIAGIKWQRTVGRIELRLAGNAACPGMSIEMIVGEALQVLRLRLGRAAIVKHFAAGQIDAACNGQRIAKKVGRGFVGRKPLTGRTERELSIGYVRPGVIQHVPERDAGRWLGQNRQDRGSEQSQQRKGRGNLHKA